MENKGNFKDKEEDDDNFISILSSGQRVKLACVNWSGAHLTAYVVNGLDKQPLAFIAEKIASLGFNCVRLTYSLDVIYQNPVIAEDRLSENPELFGKTAMEIFDLTVQALTDANLMVILNNHVKIITSFIKNLKLPNNK